MILMTRAEMRRYDALAQERYGIAGIVLMENAGRGAADLIRRLLGELPRRRGGAAPRVGIVCGPGNNGGDGFVIARHLANAGVAVRIYLMSPADLVKGDAAANLVAARAMKLDIVDCPDPNPPSEVTSSLRHDAVVVDALFGTGLDREVRGRAAAIIDVVNAAPGLKVAVDVPSGLDCDTGRPLGACVRADHTVTFGEMKIGLAIHPGVDLAGEVHVASIGAPAALPEETGWVAELLEDAIVAAMLPARPRAAHKGSFGHLALVAGTPGKSGAAVLGAEAAVRAGAGLTTVVTTRDARVSIEARVREAMVEALLADAEAPFGPAEEKAWARLAKGKTAVALGPGLGTGAGMAALVEMIVRTARAPVVIDADGLNVLAGRTDALRGAPAPRVVTPHPGEMARLAGLTTAAVQDDRIGVAKRFADAHGVVVALKGARTVVAAPGGRVFINPTGNPGMASGGSGDVLTGIVGAFLAQGLGPLEAACAGVYVHGAAADLAAGDREGRGLGARDVVRALPATLKRLARLRRTP